MLICDNLHLEIIGSKVVSTKLSQEEYGKLVGLCSASGFTVSKLLKKAILERMKEEPVQVEKKSREQELVVQKPIVAKSNKRKKILLKKKIDSCIIRIRYQIPIIC